MRRRLGQRGVTAIEFAFVAPLLVFIALAAIEFGWASAVKAALEIGIRNGGRVGATGTTGSNTSGTLASDSDRQAAIKAAVLASSGNQMLNPTYLTIEQTAFVKAADLPSTAHPNGVNGVSGPGGSGRFVVYKFTYNQPSIFTDVSGFAKRFFGSSPIPSAYVHTSTIVVTNEPF